MVKNSPVSDLEFMKLFFGKMIGGVSGLIHDLLDLHQAIDHIFGPVLPVLLMHEDQFTQMVGVAQPVIALVREIGFPVVVNGPAREVRKDAHLVRRLRSSLRMDVIVCQVFGAGHV